MIVDLQPAEYCSSRRVGTVHHQPAEFQASVGSARPTSRRGFTLVELLVVITIIGILIALLMPAVQSAREAARFATCANNIHGLAQASSVCLEQFGHFPTGGWGWRWIGDPEKGNDWKQPGSWIYNVLPFVDAQNLHDLGINSSSKSQGESDMLGTPLSVLMCPTRRPLALYHTWQKSGGGQMFDGGSCTVGDVARSDYAANGGDTYNSPGTGGGAWGDEGGPTDYKSGINASAVTAWHTISAGSNGVMCPASMTTDAMVLDGMSKTFLLGEKYLAPDNYNPTTYDIGVMDPGDNENAYMGNNADVERWGGQNYPPMQDKPGYVNTYLWGSAHPGGFNMAFCDGSVHTIQYSIDLEVFRRLSNRQDGQPISAASY